jgi:hypothetical protein
MSVAVVTGLVAIVLLIAAVGAQTFFTGLAAVVGAVLVLGLISWLIFKREA